MDPLADYTDPFAPPPMIPMGPGTLPQPVARPVPPPQPVGAPASAGGGKDAVQRALDYDPDKDPEYLASRAEQRRGMERERSTLNESDSDRQSMRDLGPPPSPAKFTEAAPDMHDYTVKGMPFILMATALGGKVAKVSGMGMLDAMTGMMNGANEGSTEAFNSSYKKWTDHYKQFQDEQKNAQDVYKANLAWRKGNFDADQAAAEAWGQYVGLAEKDMQYIVGKKNAMEKANLQIAKLNAEFSRTKLSQDAKTEKNKIKLMEDTAKYSSGATRLPLAAEKANQLQAMLPELLAKYKAKTGSTVVPNSIGQVFTALSDDPMVGTFVQLTKSLKADLVGIELPAGIRGNMFIEKIDADTAPNLWSMSASQLETAVNDVQSRFTTEAARQKALFAAFQNELSGAGGPDMSSKPTTMSMPQGAGGNAPKRVKVDAEGNVVSGN